MGSTLVYKWCSESLRGVDPLRIHRMGPTLYTSLEVVRDSLRGVDPPKIHRMGYTLTSLQVVR